MVREARLAGQALIKGLCSAWNDLATTSHGRNRTTREYENSCERLQAFARAKIGQQQIRTNLKPRS